MFVAYCMPVVATPWEILKNPRNPHCTFSTSTSLKVKNMISFVVWIIFLVWKHPVCQWTNFRTWRGDSNVLVSDYTHHLASPVILLALKQIKWNDYKTEIIKFISREESAESHFPQPHSSPPTHIHFCYPPMNLRVPTYTHVNSKLMTTELFIPICLYTLCGTSLHIPEVLISA